MPALLTHHLFGEDVYRHMSCVIGRDEASRAAFLLGNIGPDPLLCLKALPSSVSYRRIGNLMHEADPRPLFSSLHRRFVASSEGAAHAELPAFALGFFCHYLLDSTVHPLVIAQQNALVENGVAGVGRDGDELGRLLHAQIETSLDEYALTRTKGLSASEFPPHVHALACPPPELESVSRALADVVRDAYALDVPSGMFAGGVKMHRAAQRVLDSKRDGLRRRLDYARLAGPRYLDIVALTHEEHLAFSTPFANDDHVEWPHPFEAGRTLDSSFAELYHTALDYALSHLAEFAQPGFEPGKSPGLFATDFYGKPTGSK